jgi:hypothetical protein
MLEKQLMESTVGRLRYIGNHQDHLARLTTKPPRRFTSGMRLRAANPYRLAFYVAMRYYDQTAYGTVNAFQHDGMSNYALELRIGAKVQQGLGGTSLTCWSSRLTRPRHDATQSIYAWSCALITSNGTTLVWAHRHHSGCRNWLRTCPSAKRLSETPAGSYKDHRRMASGGP